MTIHFTPEIENALAQEARRQGTTAELLALECLRERFAPAVAEPRTLADFLAGHIGVLASGAIGSRRIPSLAGFRQ